MPHLDFTQPPFDVLSLAERQSIRKNAQIRYLASKEYLPVEALQCLYVVIKGQIEQSLDDEFVASYVGSIILVSQITMTGLIVAAYLSREYRTAHQKVKVSLHALISFKPVKRPYCCKSMVLLSIKSARKIIWCAKCSQTSSPND